MNCYQKRMESSSATKDDRVDLRKTNLCLVLSIIWFAVLFPAAAEAGFTLFKFDPDGNLLWTRDDSAGGGGFYYLSLDSADNVLVLGQDVLVKFNKEGTELWYLSEGGEYLAVNSNDQILYGLFRQGKQTSPVFGVAMRNRNGQLLWQNDFSHRFAFGGLLNDATNNWYLLGWDMLGSEKDFLLKYDTFGELLWSHFFKDDIYVTDVFSHDNGNLYLLLTNYQYYWEFENQILLMLNQDGVEQWSVNLGSDYRWLMTVDNDDFSYITVGYWRRLYLVIFDPSGVEVNRFTRKILLYNIEHFDDIDVDGSKNVVIHTGTPLDINMEKRSGAVIYKVYPETGEIWTSAYLHITGTSSADTKSVSMIDSNNEIIIFGDAIDEVGGSTGCLAIAKCSPDGQELWTHLNVFRPDSSFPYLDAMTAAIDSENNIYLLGRWYRSDDNDDDDSNLKKDEEEDGCGC